MAIAAKITLAELIQGLPYGKDDRAAPKIRSAYEFALQAHGEKTRESREQYIDHDLAVAQIMQELDMDIATLVASILHDVLLPHTGVTAKEIEKQFGAEVAALVTGVNTLKTYTRDADQRRLKKVDLSENGIRKKAKMGKRDADEASSPKITLEMIRHAIISIIEGDIRVALIRMADCLQELRRAGHLPRERQVEIANEAMHIYAPIANRLGVWQLKWELEDLAFRYLEPEQYRQIASQLAVRRTERAKRIETAATQLRAALRSKTFDAEVTGRPKHIYSIYRKMDRKNLRFQEIHDIHALRVILSPTDKLAYAQKTQKEKDDEDRDLCYRALGVVHSLWNPIGGEFDDYISVPKPNGYRSLHTAVIDPESGDKLEIQIRTLRMHREAEKGIAAHWAYKESDSHVSASVQRRIQNMRDVLAMLQDADTDTAGSDLLTSEITAERIHVFTPDGDVIDLPSGSTPIDFAYQIHTLVGHRCRGARVNGKMVSLDHKLKSGDRVEIITAKRGGPSRDWMNASLGYTGSARTRSKIRQWFRKQERGKNIQQGREMVERELRRLGLGDSYSVEDIARALKYTDEKDFLAKVGFGDIQSSQISGALALMEQQLKPDDEELRPLLAPETTKPRGLTVLGTSGLPTKMAGCCSPIPPDKIVGYITRGHGVTIHRADCKQLEAITDRERIIQEVDWGFETERYPVPVVVKAYRRTNLTEEISSLLRSRKITAPRTKTVTANSIMTIYMVVEVGDMEQLQLLLNQIENLPNVFEARRQHWS